jgi:peptide/nickel transport system substrate-binding protein
MGSSGVREKDGKKLSILYQTSVNSVRQSAQALIKQWWNEIGVEVELRQIDGAVFFGGDPGSPDTLQKFYADVEMYADNFEGTDAEKYLGNWVCSEIPDEGNAWQGGNTSRWCDPAFDALKAQMSTTVGEAERGAMAIKLNDMIVNGPGIIPLIHRGRVSTKSNTLGGVALSPFDSELWNAADWYRVK